MAKYSGISGELITIQNQNTVFTVKPNLTLPEVNNFSRIYGEDSKVRFALYDHSKGKGEEGVFVMYNLDLADVDMLKWDVRNHDQPCGPFQQSKIYGNTPAKSGPDQGLCPAFHISIYLQKTDKQGNLKNYPWTILISNGVAKAQPGKISGTYYEAPGSFQERKRLYMVFTRKDMIELFEKLDAYKESFRNMEIARTNFTNGYNSFIESRQGKAPSYKQATNYQPAQPSSTAPVSAPVPAPAATAQTYVPQPAQPAQPAHATPFSVLVQDKEFYAVESGAFALCRVYGEGMPEDGADKPIFFDCVPNELLDAQSRGERINLILYPKDGKIRCFGLA